MCKEVDYSVWSRSNLFKIICYFKYLLGLYLYENESPTTFQALKDQGKLFKDAKVPIYGIGIQSHFKDAHLDITEIKVLDILNYLSLLLSIDSDSNS